MRASLKYLLVGIAAIVVAAGAVARAQDMSAEGSIEPNPSYDGRYSFARLWYAANADDPCTCEVPGSAGLAGWAHDYPDGERNLMKIAADLTSLNARVDSSAVVKATDPELMRYPILYLSEPGCWHPTPAEAEGLRKYLLKGGFLIVDDFSMCTGGPVRFEMSRRIFEEQIHRVLPEGKITQVSMMDPTLNEFFKVDSARLQAELVRNTDGSPATYGIYEHNDPKKRLMVVANYNTVIHRSWVWEAQGLSSVGGGNESYKLGVNYLLYGFTH